MVNQGAHKEKFTLARLASNFEFMLSPMKIYSRQGDMVMLMCTPVNYMKRSYLIVKLILALKVFIALSFLYKSTEQKLPVRRRYCYGHAVRKVCV